MPPSRDWIIATSHHHSRNACAFVKQVKTLSADAATVRSNLMLFALPAISILKERGRIRHGAGSTLRALVRPDARVSPAVIEQGADGEHSPWMRSQTESTSNTVRFRIAQVLNFTGIRRLCLISRIFGRFLPFFDAKYIM
jgi:hypothetical protein